MELCLFINWYFNGDANMRKLKMHNILIETLGFLFFSPYCVPSVSA